MGYMRHHAIIVTTFDEERAIKARAAACAICKVDQVTELISSTINSYYTFLVAPDGSKEGWSESDAGDAARATFKQYLESQRYGDKSSPFSWVEVQYGDDEMMTLICADSDSEQRLIHYGMA